MKRLHEKVIFESNDGRFQVLHNANAMFQNQHSKKDIERVRKFFSRDNVYKQLKTMVSYLIPHRSDVKLILNIGGGSFTDGKSITVGLPNIFIGRSYGEIFTALRALVGHEAQHVNSSDFEGFVSFQKEVAKYFGDKYPALRSPFSQKHLMKVAHHFGNSVEDGRIEKILGQLFKGYIKYLKFLNISLWEAQPIQGNSELEDFLYSITSFCVTGLEPKEFKSFYKGTEVEENLNKIKPMILSGIEARTCKDCLNITFDIIKAVEPYLVKLLTERAKETEDFLNNMDDTPEFTTSEESQHNNDPDDADTHFQPKRSKKKNEEEQKEQEKQSSGEETEGEEEKQDSKNSGSKKKKEKKEESEEEGVSSTSSSKEKEEEEKEEEENKEGEGGVSTDDTSEEEENESDESDEGDKEDTATSNKNEEENSESDESEDDENPKNENDSDGDDREKKEDQEDSETDSDDASDDDASDSNNSDDSSDSESNESEKDKGDEEDEETKADHRPKGMDDKEADEVDEEEVVSFLEELTKEVEEDANERISQKKEDIQKQNYKKEDFKLNQDELQDLENRYRNDMNKHFKEMTNLSLRFHMPTDLKREGTRFRKEVERIFRNKEAYTLRGQRKGVLDAGNLHRLQTKDFNVFVKKGVPVKSEYVAYLLEDGSGSMMEDGKWNESKRALSIMEEGLKGILPFKITTFNTDWNGNSVVHQTIKDFKDENKAFNYSFNAFQQRRPGGGNKDGYSIRVATKELLKRPEKDRILIIFSDGLPSCYRGGMQAGMVDVKEAVKEARKAGIFVVSLLFGTESFRDLNIESYRYMYEKNIISCEPNMISNQLTRMLKKIISH